MTTEVPEHALIVDSQMRTLFRADTRHEVIKDVEVAFAVRDGSYSAPLQIVIKDLDTADAAFGRELEFGVLSIAGSIGVEKGAAMAKGFEDVFGSRDRRCELVVLLARRRGAEGEEGLCGQTPRLGFPGPGFSTG